MGQEDDPEATTIDLASSEEEEVVVVMMIHHHHMITILHPSQLQHVQHLHQLKKGGDQVSGLEHWVVRRRDTWRGTEVRISNRELSVPPWVMGVMITGKGVRDGLVGRAQDRVGVLALAPGLGLVGMRARALGERVGGKSCYHWEK